MGRGPLETKAWIVEDMIVVRLRGMLTRAEQRLVRNGKNRPGCELIKRMRNELIESERGYLETAIRSAVKCKVKSIHADISTVTGEKIFIFSLDKYPEFVNPGG